MISKAVASACVAGGGALGALLRYHVGRAVQPDVAFPVGTLVVNVSGCFAFGLLGGLLRGRGESVQLFVFTGVVGGYTTFSAFGHEAISLLRVAPARGATYVALSVAAGLLGLLAGAWLGERLAPAPRG